MITRNHRQESLSRAYVQAVAARAGVVCSVPDLDYGVDLTLRLVDEANGFEDAGVLLDVQLKSTSAELGGEPQSLGFDLRVTEYNRLRRPDVPVPRILVVLELPPDENQWLTQTLDELILRRAAYWISLRESPPVIATKTTRVKLPRSRVFTPIALSEILARIASGGVP